MNVNEMKRPIKQFLLPITLFIFVLFGDRLELMMQQIVRLFLCCMVTFVLYAFHPANSAVTDFFSDLGRSSMLTVYRTVYNNIKEDRQTDIIFVLLDNLFRRNVETNISGYTLNDK